MFARFFRGGFDGLAADMEKKESKKV